MTSDSATNYSLAYSALRTRLVREDRHRFALPGEPEPGYRARRARAQNVALLVAVAILAAGSGSRFARQGSGPKPLANLRGRPL